MFLVNFHHLETKIKNKILCNAYNLDFSENNVPKLPDFEVTTNNI
jgi:hypothetical protein